MNSHRHHDDFWPKALLLVLLIATAPARAEDVSVPKALPPAPVFPLKSDKFKQIDDSYIDVLEKFDRTHQELEPDSESMEAVLLALTASPQEHLIQNINPALTFKMLIDAPDKYRGEVFRMTGILSEVKVCELSPNASGITKMWKGQISSLDGKMIAFRSLEPLPENLKPGQSVQSVGVFMQCYWGRYTPLDPAAAVVDPDKKAVQLYSNLDRESSDRLSWTPLVFVRRVEPYAEPIQVLATVSDSMNKPAVIVVFLVVCLGICAMMYSRMKYKISMANPFTQLRIKKEGAPSYFPRRAPPKKTKKPSENNRVGTLL